MQTDPQHVTFWHTWVGTGIQNHWLKYPSFEISVVPFLIGDRTHRLGSHCTGWFIFHDQHRPLCLQNVSQVQILWHHVQSPYYSTRINKHC